MNIKSIEKMINEYVAKLTFAISCQDGKTLDDNITRQLASRALYAIVTKDNHILRYKDKHFDNFEFSYDSFKDQPNAKFNLDAETWNDLDEYEQNNLLQIIEEKTMRDFFFVEQKEPLDQYDYFLFSPIEVSVLRKSPSALLLYPSIKVKDNETVIVEFRWFSDGQDLDLSEFVDRLPRASTRLASVKFSSSYFDAANREFNDSSIEHLVLESGDTYMAEAVDFEIRDFLGLAEQFVTMVFSYTTMSWFSQISVSVSDADLSDWQVRKILNGLPKRNVNSRYLTPIQDFSQIETAHLYVSGSAILSIGDIDELIVPASVASDEICILNCQIQGYTDVIDGEAGVNELLDAKEGLLKLRHLMREKYNRTLMFHEIILYASEELFNINTAISDVTDLIDVAVEKQNQVSGNQNRAFQTLLAVLSVLLSATAIKDSLIQPIYMIIFGDSPSLPVQVLMYLLITALLAFLIREAWVRIRNDREKVLKRK